MKSGLDNILPFAIMDTLLIQLEDTMPTLKELVEKVAPLLDTDATFPWSRSTRFDLEDGFSLNICLN